MACCIHYSAVSETENCSWIFSGRGGDEITCTCGQFCWNASDGKTHAPIVHANAPPHHESFRNMQGWTADDYEVGGKGKAADFDEEPTETGDHEEQEKSSKAQERKGTDGISAGGHSSAPGSQPPEKTASSMSN